jgi:FlaA1/EpsC-like NDP-sugar epimerase
MARLLCSRTMVLCPSPFSATDETSCIRLRPLLDQVALATGIDKMQLGFEVKNTVVTGADSGIGAAVSRQFGEEGAQVVVADLDPDTAHRIAAEIRLHEGKAHEFAIDVADAEAAKHATTAARSSNL